MNYIGIGALVAVGVTAHIAALNYCYDIPVKLFSTTLLLMAIYLAGNDLRRIFDVFVLASIQAPLDGTVVAESDRTYSAA